MTYMLVYTATMPFVHLVIYAVLLIVIFALLLARRKAARGDSIMRTHNTSPHQVVQHRAPLVNHAEEKEDDELELLNRHTIERYMQVEEQPAYNMGSRDFFRFSQFQTTPEIRKAWDDSLQEYGTGSCGPRPFYGTMDVHRQLEERMKEWLGFEGALLYSGWKQLVKSIPSIFAAGRKHVIIYDEAVRFPLIQGVELSRCRGIPFQHNSVKDLERILAELPAEDEESCRFVYVEGIYLNRSALEAICPLHYVVRAAQRYHCRVILDDTLAVGVLGDEGRGSIEYHTKVSQEDISLMIVGLDAAFGTNGALCLGERDAIRYQHAGALGFTFSASLPPMHAKCGLVALDLIRDDKHQGRLAALRAECSKFLEALRNLNDDIEESYIHQIDDEDEQSHTPIFHLYVSEVETMYLADDIECVELRMLLTTDIEKAVWEPRVKLETMLEHVSADIEEMTVRVPRVIHDARNVSLHPPCLRIALHTDGPEDYPGILDAIQTKFNLYYYR